MNKTLAASLFTLSLSFLGACTGVHVDGDDPGDDNPALGGVETGGDVQPPAHSSSPVTTTECDPDTLVCNADGELQGCAHDGTIASVETCAKGCSSDNGAHCEHVVPVYAPNACDDARADTLEITNDLSTEDVALCNGGIVDQAGGSKLCIVRAHSIHLAADQVIHVVGPNALALVSDEDLDLDGVLDLGAKGTVSGPGGGFIASGGRAQNGFGAGGAGYRTAGGAGGSFLANGGADNAGDIAADPTSFAALTGGPRSASDGGGGGGGAATLVSCTGAVRVTGVVSSGGGGGQPNAGGGAGGYIVFQGLEVHITGLAVTNGGGGGAGSIGVGTDGRASDTVAAGGADKLGSGGAGGAGAFHSAGAGQGKRSLNPEQPGSGGGGNGFLQVYVPAGGAVELQQLTDRFQKTLNVAVK